MNSWSGFATKAPMGGLTIMPFENSEPNQKRMKWLINQAFDKVETHSTASHFSVPDRVWDAVERVPTPFSLQFSLGFFERHWD
jgi:hypothetical protein